MRAQSIIRVLFPPDSLFTSLNVRVSRMTPHIHPDVEDIRDSPEEGESVRLAIVPDEGESSSVAGNVESLGGEVHEVLPSGTLSATVKEQRVDELCETEGIMSISPDGELRILA